MDKSNTQCWEPSRPEADKYGGSLARSGALWQLCKEDESLIMERKVYLGQSEQQGS